MKQPSKVNNDQYVREQAALGRSAAYIAQFFNVTDCTILNYCKKHNIILHKARKRYDQKTKLTKEFLEEQKSLKKTIVQISQETNFGEQTIVRYAKKHNVKFPRKCESDFVDLTGQEFDKLTVIHRMERQGNHSTTYWWCECICGNKRRATSQNLKKGSSHQCVECSRKDKDIRCKGYGDISGGYWASIKKGCKNRALGRVLEFNITIEYAWELFLKQNRKCALSGLDLYFTSNHKKCKEQTASLDRIDSTKGYIVGNVQWLHKEINIMKHAHDQDKFIELCGLVYKNKMSIAISDVVDYNENVITNNTLETAGHDC